MQKRKKASKSATMAWLKANGRMVVVSVLAVLLMGNFVVAQTGDGNFWDNTAKYLAQMLASDMRSADDEVSLGADIADSTYLNNGRPATVVPYENVWVENDLDVGGTAYLTTVKASTTEMEDTTLVDGANQTEYFYKVIDFTDNTTTPVIWSSDDDSYNDFYLMDMWVENTGKATSSLRTCISTTTAGTLFGADDATLLTDDAGACTLARTFGNAFGADDATFDSLTATSSMFSIYEYPGTDTRVANRINGFLINSTTDIFVRATSTGTTYDSGLMGSDTSAGKLHILGRESDR